jgi:putative lipoprotein
MTNLYESLHATERQMNRWAIENAVNNASEMRYAFADLNNDGIEEFLIADLNLSGKYLLTGIYYLQAGKPVLLAEGFMSELDGGNRSATIIYKGGQVLELSWTSGTDIGYGILYQLNAKQETAKKLQEKEIQIQANDFAADFGKNASDQIDLRGLDWKEFDFSSSLTKSTTEQKAPWNQSKSAKLEIFIKGWGERLGQPNYQKGIAGGDVGADHLYTLRDDGPSEKMNAEYSDTGLGNAQYRIVERYSNWDKYPDVHSYFFAITNTGEAIVFHSQTTNGGVMYLRPTKNTEIQAEFKRLVEVE